MSDSFSQLAMNIDAIKNNIPNGLYLRMMSDLQNIYTQSQPSLIETGDSRFDIVSCKNCTRYKSLLYLVLIVVNVCAIIYVVL